MYRETELVEGEIFHVFNRGVEKQNIFLSDEDRIRFVLGCCFFNDANVGEVHLNRFLSNPVGYLVSDRVEDRDKYVEILAWCLMPNHFHLLVRVLKEGGLSVFMQKLQESHSKYFNRVNKRKGVLFGGPFQSVHVSSDAQYTHVSRYIHINPLDLFDPMWKERGYIEDKLGAEKFLKEYKWSSLLEYLGEREDFASIIDLNPVLDYFENKGEEYWKFLMDWITVGYQVSDK